MADERHGYNVAVGYTENFFFQMAPHWLDFCMRAQGFDSHRTGPSYRYADLGCGTGFHVCLLAAANPQAEFVGIDFDSDIARGQQLAAAAGLTNVSFIQADFLDLAENWPTELGAFDYIALQGILSWVSHEVRAAVLQCVAQASKAGTVASFGYNVPPGWLSYLPFQHVAHHLSESHDANAAIGGAIAIFRRLRDADSQFFMRMPLFKAHLERLAAESLSYLAHEFLPDHWTPLWHSDVAQQLRSVGLTYVGSANVADALLPNSLPPGLAAIISEQMEDSLREDVQDIAVTRQFRRDIFCNKPQSAKSDVLSGNTPVYLMYTPQEGVPVRLTTGFGALTVDYGVVADILAALADGPKPVAALMELKNPARPSTRRILLPMLEMQMLTLGNAGAGSAEIAARFNAAVARTAAGGGSYMHLAAAALGSGAQVTEPELLLLDTWLSAGRSIGPENLAHGLAHRLKALGRQLQFRGSPIPPEQLQSRLGHLAHNFIDQLLPRWRRLGVLQ